MESWLFELNLPPFLKLKIMFINLFSVLYKAATLNFSRIQQDLQDVQKAFPKQISISVYVMQTLIPFFLLVKFTIGFCSLASKVIAMLPILTDDHPEMLLPCMISQLIENLLLPVFELVLGLAACKYTESDCRSMILVFIISIGLRLVFGTLILNVYMNFYSKILAAKTRLPPHTQVKRLSPYSKEIILHKENLL